MPPPPRNVLNADAVDAFLAEVIADSRADDLPGVHTWLASSARRWILRDYERYWRVERESVTDLLVLVDPHDPGERVVGPYDEPAPDWIVKAMARGDEIVVIRLNATLRKLLERVIDWARETTPRGQEPPLTRMGVPDAIGQAAAWRRNQRTVPDHPPGTRLVYTYAGTYHFFRLETPEALEIEGERMANCVGSYAWDVENGDCQIISMRRMSDGASRATIEIDADGYVQQAKGHANGAVRKEDRLALRTFVETYGYRVVWDHESFDVPQNVENLGGWDGHALSRFILSADGQGWLNGIRFASVEDLDTTPAGHFFRQIQLQQAHLGDRARRRLFDALAPTDRPIVMRPAHVAQIYDEELSVIRVLGPTPLFQLVERDAFEPEQRRIAREMAERATAMLPTLALREPDRVFDLGLWRSAHHAITYDGLSGGPANLLVQCDIDITLPRRQRLNALRRRMNAAKYRTVGRMAQPSEPHLAMRRLLDGEDGRYVV